ncbi:unnamed protein product [Phytomonas sp. EM1]|nr:unnamed protein product [Phytomonas sp. EM1]|eukprot:CCW61162.1 unnamed protein product [Phytomonas sp. isolate EM1]
MLLRTIISRTARTLEKPLSSVKGVFAPHSDGLHFAERAVKSTASEPFFFCGKRLLSCRAADSYAAVASELLPFLTSSGPSEAPGASSQSIAPRCPTPGLLKPRTHVYLQGHSVLCVFRNNKLSFLSKGDEWFQRHELSLLENDVLALLCPVHANEDAHKLFTSAFKQFPCDMEYIAEELLLKLGCPMESGSTSVVARAACSVPTWATEPPCSHLNL